MKTITAYFVRHGQTMMNRYNKVQGWIDSPLTKKGIADANRAGKQLKAVNFTAAYSSDSGRAIETAHHILKANPHNMNIISYQFPEFREQCHGYFEGNDLNQMWQFVGEQVALTSESAVLGKYGLEKARDLIHKADLYGDAENNRMFWDRLDRGFNKLRANSSDGDVVLVVSHGMTIRSIVDRYAPELDKGAATINGSITKLTITDDNIEIEFFNRIDYTAE
ncbi:histidine phosphatase family protein [Secundilactobacillus kimchicus]|uniref:histidine phosphatase family protein n=1 Tax=Secundilactobacillus kimchicus TaxID=528209 RepID=UPI001C02CF12|nr:histidine phosphatase family protein [Secundilactobacillus kimchicus]MBT9671434.1 histidine phosphatase family protein [Secundilactobacillus kimchicus]